MRVGVLAALCCGVATWHLARVWQPMPLVHAANWLVLGLLGVPLLFTVALALVAATLSAVLTGIALPWILCRRRTGLKSLLADCWCLPASILPGYWRALRRVRRPALWGCLAGFVAGIGAFVAVHGFRPST
jgi:hypothetical protein